MLDAGAVFNRQDTSGGQERWQRSSTGVFFACRLTRADPLSWWLFCISQDLFAGTSAYREQPGDVPVEDGVERRSCADSGHSSPSI